MTREAGFHPPSDGQACESFVRVRFHEVDALGHVNNAAYLNYLEQAAIDHATWLGLDLERLRRFGGVFVARRHEIDFLRPAYAGDLLRVVTWLDEPRGARVDRRYLVFREADAEPSRPCGGRVARGGNVGVRGERVVQAVTEWVFTGEGGRPRRIPEAVIAAFGAEPTG